MKTDCAVMGIVGGLFLLAVGIRIRRIEVNQQCARLAHLVNTVRQFLIRSLKLVQCLCIKAFEKAR